MSEHNQMQLSEEQQQTLQEANLKEIIDYFSIEVEQSKNDRNYPEYLVHGKSEPIQSILGDELVSKHVKAKDEAWSKEKGVWKKINNSWTLIFTETGFQSLVRSLTALMVTEQAEKRSESKPATQASEEKPAAVQVTMTPVHTNGNSTGTSTALVHTNGEDKKQQAPGVQVGDQGIQLRSLGDMFRWGEAVIQSKMAPKGYETPQQVMIATQMGFELGLKPLMALQSIAVIGNIPSVWGDGAWALVLSSPAYETHREWFEGEGNNLTAFCEIKRKGVETPIKGYFSMQEAIDAKLHEKDTWKKYKRRMLQWRARSWAMRDGFADVLKGFKIAEEVMDYPPEAFKQEVAPVERPKFENIQEAEVTEPIQQ